LGLLSQVDRELAEKVAIGLGATVPPVLETPINKGVSPENEETLKHEPRDAESAVESSDALSMIINPTNSPTIASRKVAIICTDGVSEASVMNMKSALIKEDAKGFVVAPHLGSVLTDSDGAIAADYSLLTASSVLFDAVYIPHGMSFDELAEDDAAAEFINDAYKHCKVIGADGKATGLLSAMPFASKISNDDSGIILACDPGTETFALNCINAMASHRVWEREQNLYINTKK
jgi:catalase